MKKTYIVRLSIVNDLNYSFLSQTDLSSDQRLENLTKCISDLDTGMEKSCEMIIFKSLFTFFEVNSVVWAGHFISQKWFKPKAKPTKLAQIPDTLGFGVRGRHGPFVKEFWQSCQTHLN